MQHQQLCQHNFDGNVIPKSARMFIFRPREIRKSSAHIQFRGERLGAKDIERGIEGGRGGEKEGERERRKRSKRERDSEEKERE